MIELAARHGVHRPACRVLAWMVLLSGPAQAAMAGQANAPQANPPARANPPTPANPGTGSSGASQGAAGAAVPDDAAAAVKKVIEDPTEYNAYTAAVNTQDQTEQAEALESFATKYPKSVVMTEALERAMWDWQSAGDTVKVLEVAKELLTADSGNVRALAVVVALDRVSAAQGDASALDEICRYSTAGMREVAMWQKPTGMADADFAALNKQMGRIFNSAAGYCALQQSNYSQARDWFARAVEGDAPDLQDVYDLAIADLELTPMDASGFWYCAKAIQLAKNSPNATAAGGMEAYCKPKYETYHGSVQGWDAILAASAAQPALPEGFAASIKPAPSAAKQK